jgi:hypothetical protein
MSGSIEVKKMFRLDNPDIMKQKANDVVSLLKHYTSADPCPADKLAEDSGLTKGQLARVIKYMRRCSESDLERYIAYYPISSKKGYFLPKQWDDFAPCFATLNAWVMSLQRTIEPMKQKMELAGVDWRKYMTAKYCGEYSDELDNWLDSIPEQNKDTSWFLNI